MAHITIHTGHDRGALFATIVLNGDEQADGECSVMAAGLRDAIEAQASVFIFDEHTVEVV